MRYLAKLNIRQKLFGLLALIAVLPLVAHGWIAGSHFFDEKRRDTIALLNGQSRDLDDKLKSEMDRLLESALSRTNGASDALTQDQTGLIRFFVYRLDQGKLELTRSWSADGTARRRTPDDKIELALKSVLKHGRHLSFIDQSQEWLLGAKSLRGQSTFLYLATLRKERLLSLLDSGSDGFGSPAIVSIQGDAPGFHGTGDFEPGPTAKSKLFSTLSTTYSDQDGVFLLDDPGLTSPHYIATVRAPGIGWILSALPQTEFSSLFLGYAIRSGLFFLFILALIPPIAFLVSARMTSRLLGLVSATSAVADGDFDVRIDDTAGDEIGRLGSRFNHMAERVKALMIDTKEKARMESELKVAQAVQNALVPTGGFTSECLEISGYYRSASECGGDLWFYRELGHRVFIMIGDATGHGVAPALVTSAAHGIMTVIDTFPDLELDDLVKLLNNAIHRTSKGRINMTAFVACIDTRTGIMEYCLVSHELPFIVHAGNHPPTKKDVDFLACEPTSLFGISPEISPNIGSVQLVAGDQLWIYTDGVTELANESGKLLGDRKMTKAVLDAIAKEDTLDRTIQSIATSLSEYQGAHPADDDMTFCMVRFKRAGATA